MDETALSPVDLGKQNRAATLLKIYTLLVTGQAKNEKQACALVGISPRTLQRWKKDGALSAALSGDIQRLREQQAVVASAVADAFPEAVAKLINKVLGHERMSDNAWIAAFHELRDLHSVLNGVNDEANDGEAEAYLQKDKQWLTGPRTVTVEMDDGTTVTVKSGQPQVVEGEAVSVEDDFPARKTTPQDSQGQLPGPSPDPEPHTPA